MCKQRNKGITQLYAIVSIVSLLAVISLATDWGRVQVVKTQLQTSADAAARYAVSGLQNTIDGASAAKDNAAAVVSQNFADSHSINFDRNLDVELGKYSTTTHLFTVTSTMSQANAIRVTLRCTSARGSAVPLLFLAVLGKRSQDVTVSSIAMIDYAAIVGGTGNGNYSYYVPSDSNPWLSGMPSGTVANNNNPANNPDYAGTEYADSGTGSTSSNTNYTAKKASPIKAGGITVTPGGTISFDGVNGGANNFQSQTLYTGDGNLDWITDNLNGAENGISDLYAPINSVVGVFLSDSQPTSGSTPSTLDFSTPASRDFLSFSPKLKQAFFIGDGRNSSGEVQRIIVPPGATRLYVGSMDGWEWNNNVGGFSVVAHASGKIYSVK